MAKSIITKIVTSFSNSALRCPVAWAQLSCGHTGKVKVVPNTYSCAECERETTKPSKCPCGSKGGFNFKYQANPHRAEDRLTFVGDEVECAHCDHYAARLAQLRALKPGDVQHSRFRHNDSRGFGPGVFYVYKRDPKSPTGVTLLTSIEATKEAEELLRSLRAAPLSPTEPR